MNDVLPSDTEFTEFLETVTLARVLRTNRPHFRGYELRMYRAARTGRQFPEPRRTPRPKQTLAEIRKSDTYRALQMAREMKAEVIA